MKRKHGKGRIWELQEGKKENSIGRNRDTGESDIPLQVLGASLLHDWAWFSERYSAIGPGLLAVTMQLDPMACTMQSFPTEEERGWEAEDKWADKGSLVCAWEEEMEKKKRGRIVRSTFLVLGGSPNILLGDRK